MSRRKPKCFRPFTTLSPTACKKHLQGDGNYPGFLEIIDDYGMTDAANLAHYYAGVLT